jgi:hypothetical protein
MKQNEESCKSGRAKYKLCRVRASREPHPTNGLAEGMQDAQGDGVAVRHSVGHLKKDETHGNCSVMRDMYILGCPERELSICGIAFVRATRSCDL